MGDAILLEWMESEKVIKKREDNNRKHPRSSKKNEPESHSPKILEIKISTVLGGHQGKTFSKLKIGTRLWMGNQAKKNSKLKSRAPLDNSDGKLLESSGKVSNHVTIQTPGFPFGFYEVMLNRTKE